MPTDYGATLPVGPTWRAKYTPTGYAPPGWTQQGERAFYANQEASMGRTHQPMTNIPWQRGGGTSPMQARGPQPVQTAQATSPVIGNIGSSNVGNVRTTINPQRLYSDLQTQQAENLIRAEAAQNANLPYLMKSMDRPGVSRGAGQMAMAGAKAGNILSAGDEGAANLFFQDYLANQKHLLEGQTAREREAIGLSNILARLQEAQQEAEMRSLSNQMGLLSGF